MNNIKSKTPNWILPYSKRKKISRKLSDTLKEIRQSRTEGNWNKVKTLSRLIRRVWWGIKRYRNV